MENELTLKVYEMDYSFIIKNYLDTKLWGQTWNLFIYKDYVFTLNLSSIDVKNNTIVFEVRNNKLMGCNWRADIYSDNEEIRHNIGNSNIDVLKRQINGAIERLIWKLEKVDIVNSTGYEQMLETISEEKDVLRKIANDFLDENGVSNREIRDVYVGSYVSNNSQSDKYKSQYIDDNRYKVLTDLYLVFYRAIKDEIKEGIILSSIDESRAEEMLKEINEYMKKLQTEEYQEELKDELEDI